jgi:Arc/MetJ family transcription regulator
MLTAPAGLASLMQWSGICDVGGDMRTTVRLDDDVAARVEQLRQQRQLTLSEAVNELARAGLRARPQSRPFRQRTRPVKMRIDVSNVAEALDQLDDTGHAT